MQPYLFGFLEDEVGELDESLRLFVQAAESADIGIVAERYGWCGNGRKPSDRLAIFKLFLMKHVLNLPASKEAVAEARRSPAVRRLCGWESLSGVPSESTVSRAFADFARDRVIAPVFTGFVKSVTAGRVILHRSMDSTEIDARERAAAGEEKEAAAALAAARAGAGPEEADVNAPALQEGRDAETNLALLPTLCDWGCKRNSKGRTQYWRGYKLHIAVADGDFPVAACLTSASVHDSKAAIPLMQTADAAGVSLYDLADAAYDSAEIRAFSEANGHVPIIARNPRRGDASGDELEGLAQKSAGFTPPEKARFSERSGVERVNGHLHDSHGGRTVRVRGHDKVFLHLMLGLLVVAVEQAARMLC